MSNEYMYCIAQMRGCMFVKRSSIPLCTRSQGVEYKELILVSELVLLEMYHSYCGIVKTNENK